DVCSSDLKETRKSNVEIGVKYILILITKSFYDSARRNRCSVPAPSVRFSVGGRMVIARQWWGKGSDRRGRNAAGPGESIEVASCRFPVPGRQPATGNRQPIERRQRCRR